MSISNTTLGPSGHDSTPPSSRLGTLYSRCRQWFLTEINVLSIVLFIRHQFKCSELVHNTILSPSGHGTKPPSSRLGTLYSCYRQWFITKIHVLRQFLFVQRQFKRWGSISNTTLGPSGHVWSHHRRGWGPCTAIKGNGLWQKSMYLTCFCLSDVNSSIGVGFKHHTGHQWPW